MKKICFLGNILSVHTIRWVNYFAEHDWQVYLITWRYSKETNINRKVKVYRLFFPPHYIFRYAALLEFSRIVKEISPDLIHAHYISHFGVLAGLYCSFTGFRPLLLTAWGSDIWIDAKGWQKKLISLAIRRADFITCDGDNIRKEIIRLGGQSDKTSIIYFGTDTKQFSPEKEDNSIKTEAGNSPIVISTRNLHPIYDIKSLIEAIPNVLRFAPDAKFFIIGKGSEESNLKELAKSLNIASSVNFIGWVSNNRLAAYLASSDIYVSTSLSDGGLAASTAEAMASGLPVVITDFGDNRKWVEDGKNGCIVPLKNPRILAEKIVFLLNNENVRKNFGILNRAIIKEKNNYYKEMAKMERIYNKIIERYTHENTYNWWRWLYRKSFM